MIDSLYRLAVGWNGAAQSRRLLLLAQEPPSQRVARRAEHPSRRRMYILSDKPMSESEWIEQRTIAEQKRLPSRSMMLPLALPRRPGHQRKISFINLINDLAHRERIT